MAHESFVLTKCLEVVENVQGQRANCRDEDLSPRGGIRFTRVTDHGNELHNMMAKWFGMASQYHSFMIDLPTKYLRQEFKALVLKATEYALSAVQQWMLEASTFIRVFEARGGFNVWEISAAEYGVTTIIKDEICGMKEHLIKSFNFFEDFDL